MMDLAKKLDNKPLMWGLTAGIGLAFLMAGTLSAQAKIKCEGRFQIVKSQGKISTPFCEDNYLAAVARSYGRKVSGAAVRRNPGLKASVCRQVGHDYRLTDICANHRPGGNRKGFPF